jgi:hypothetical protein
MAGTKHTKVNMPLANSFEVGSFRCGGLIVPVTMYPHGNALFQNAKCLISNLTG